MNESNENENNRPLPVWLVPSDHKPRQRLRR
jgi:hypothetical protein